MAPAGAPSSPAPSVSSSPSPSVSSSLSSSASSPSLSATEAATESAAPSAAASGSAGAGNGNLSAQGQVVLQAIAQVAAQTGIQPNKLSLQRAEETEWPDGSLGCPSPGAAYIQVVTPGYKVVLTDGIRTYDIHASRQGKVVWCDNGTPKSLTGNNGGG